MADVNELERRALRQDALCNVETMHVQASSMFMTLSPTPHRPQEKKLESLRTGKEGGSRFLRAKLEPIITGSEATADKQSPTARQHISSLVKTRPTPSIESPVEADKGSLSRTSTKRSVGLGDAYDSEKGALSMTSTKGSVVRDDVPEPEPEERPLSAVSVLSAKSPRRSTVSSRSAHAENGLSSDTSPTRSVVMISPLDTEKWPSLGVNSTDFAHHLVELDANPVPVMQSAI